MSQFGSRPIRQKVIYTQDTEPDDRRSGVLWVDTSQEPPRLYQFDPDLDPTNNGWRPVNTTFSGTTAPDPSMYEVWVDTSNSPPITKTHDGSNWVSTTPSETGVNAMPSYLSGEFSGSQTESPAGDGSLYTYNVQRVKPWVWSDEVTIERGPGSDDGTPYIDEVTITAWDGTTLVNDTEISMDTYSSKTYQFDSANVKDISIGVRNDSGTSSTIEMIWDTYANPNGSHIHPV